jgi:hypothetical protein
MQVEVYHLVAITFFDPYPPAFVSLNLKNTTEHCSSAHLTWLFGLPRCNLNDAPLEERRGNPEVPRSKGFGRDRSD